MTDRLSYSDTHVPFTRTVFTLSPIYMGGSAISQPSLIQINFLCVFDCAYMLSQWWLESTVIKVQTLMLHWLNQMDGFIDLEVCFYNCRQIIEPVYIFASSSIKRA